MRRERSVRACLILGTNIGDRRANLAIAKSLIVTELASFLFSDLTESDVMETAPWGFEAETPFLNQAVSFMTDISPEDLLKVCQYVEQKMGRKPHEVRFGRNGERLYESRIIDIDIVLYGDETVDLPHLKIPHPQIKERDYARSLLSQILP